MTTRLDLDIAKVVAAGNCSGCGACALLSPRVTMGIDESGFARPVVRAARIGDVDDADAVALFARACPGRRVPAPPAQARRHPVFGTYVSAWAGWATDPDSRFAGSSGGVLTALTAWLVETGLISSVAGAAASAVRPTRTVPVRITSREEALASSGSRYAPVGVAASAELGVNRAVIGKPCEISAIREIASSRAVGDGPLLLSFFCAGTHSQRATDGLIRELGLDVANVDSLRYRGNGWPGRFTAVDNSGNTRSTSYEDSWGSHLGRDLQWRCKVCVDGMGDHADISVGDYWHASEDGYPEFEDEPGRSVILVRTHRGQEVLEAAASAGILTLQSVDLDAVAHIQPLQVERKRMLAARLAGRLLAGRPIPRYPGYKLVRLSLASPVKALRSIIGTFRRSLWGSGDR